MSRGELSLIFPLPWRSQGSPSKLFGKQKLSKAQGAFHRVSLESDAQAGSLGTFTTQHPVGRVSGQELAYVISIYLTTGKKTPTRSFPVWSCNVILYYFSFWWTTLLALDEISKLPLRCSHFTTRIPLEKCQCVIGDRGQWDSSSLRLISNFIWENLV